MSAPALKKRFRYPVDDAQRRRFFLLLKAVGYVMPGDKALAYSDLGITSTKEISYYEMVRILAVLQTRADKLKPKETPQAGPERSEYATPEERFEGWRRIFFPENVIAFGSDPKKRIISKRQQDFILTHAIQIFKQPDNFSAWLFNWSGCRMIAERDTANTACRGLNPMAERHGLDPAPPSGSRNRRFWEMRQAVKQIAKEGAKNEE